ncbi:MAG TPA: helix-turn-helix domain-containing protein [Streptosporangiales bacterium]
MPVVLSSEDVPRTQRPAYWQHVVGDNVVPMEMRYADRLGFRSRMTVRELGDVTVIEVAESSGMAVRTPAHVRRSAPDMYQLMLQRSGTAVVEREGSQVRVEPGCLRLGDAYRPFRSVHSDQREVILAFPRALLPLRSRDTRVLVGRPIPGDRGAAALLAEFVRRLPVTADEEDEVQRSRLGTVALDLVSVVLAGETGRDPEAFAAAERRTLMARVEAFVESRLHDPALSPAVIAAAHHVSVRQLYKVFETRGYSVARFVRLRRLERCRRDLADPALASRPAYAIGLAWGFTDPAHFTRSFREEYGVPPGEYRSRAAVPPDR